MRVPPLVVALAALVSLGAAEFATARGGKPPRLEPRPGLVDCRSPELEVGRRVALGETYLFRGFEIVFARDRRGRLRSAVRPEGGGRMPSRATLKNLPALLKIGRRGKEYGLSVALEPDGEAVRVFSAQGLPIRVGTHVAHLLDADMDGTAGTKGDALVAPGCRTLGPWTGEVWSPSGGVLVTIAEDGRTSASPLPVPKPGSADHTAAWRRFQWRRQQCGLRTVAYDASLEPSMRAHAAYLFRNKARTHGQDPQLPGYSPEGHLAGSQSVLGYNKNTLQQALIEQMDTLYHRFNLMDARLAKTGFVLHQGVFVMNTKRFVRHEDRFRPTVYPSHGMEDVPTVFNPTGEAPMPVAGAPYIGHGLGPSIAAYVPMLLQQPRLPSAPELTVRVAKKGAKPLAGAFHYPGHAPPGVGASNFGCVGFTPTRPLESKTTYRCELKLSLGFRPGAREGTVLEYAWEFTTR